MQQLLLIVLSERSLCGFIFMIFYKRQKEIQTKEQWLPGTKVGSGAGYKMASGVFQRVILIVVVVI